MKKLRRDHIEEFINTTKSIVVAAWFDNKRVLAIFNHIGERPVGECSRFDKKQQQQKKNPSQAASFNFYLQQIYRWFGQSKYFIIPLFYQMSIT